MRLTEAEWRARLTPRSTECSASTEPSEAFVGCFVATKEPGTYTCAGCGNPLFESGTKFESGTGWPSFFKPVNEEALTLRKDHSHGMSRVEVLCSRCDGHLGHVFEDDPPPTGLRYCMNSVALRHVSKGAPLELVQATVR